MNKLRRLIKEELYKMGGAIRIGTEFEKETPSGSSSDPYRKDKLKVTEITLQRIHLKRADPFVTYEYKTSEGSGKQTQSGEAFVKMLIEDDWI